MAQQDLSKLIKRLELIKNLISLEEDDEINEHLNRLKLFIEFKQIEDIVNLLNNKEYLLAVNSIDNFLLKYNQVSVYIDFEADSLKLEVKALETNINKLSQEKAELEKIIYEFGVRHNAEFGEIIIKILNYQRQNAKGTKDEQEAEKQYTEFNENYKKSKDQKFLELSVDQLKELKENYRKASKLCHPDVVKEEQKEIAQKLFSDLSNAYERNDINKVNDILTELSKGNYFINKSDSVDKKELLKKEVEAIRLKIRELKDSIDYIKQNEPYVTIKSISDWDEYFKLTKQKFEQKFNELQYAG